MAPIRAALLIALLAALPAAAQTSPVPDAQVAAKADVLDHDPHTPVLGNPKGDVTIVEFVDYDCAICKAIEPGMEAFLRADPKVRLVVKEFPVLTPASLTSSKLALAAARQGKFAAFHQAILLYRGPLNEKAIWEVAKKAGVDVARAKKDMAASVSADAISDAIYADMNLARALRLFAAPAFVIGDRIVTEPALSLDFAEPVAAARTGPAG